MRIFSLIARTARIFAITFLVLTGSWLTAAWIASHLWPADHALLQFFQNVDFAKTNRRHFHFDIVDWPQSSRRLAVIFLDKSDDHLMPITKLSYSSRFPGIYYQLSNANAGDPNSPVMQLLTIPAWLCVLAVWPYPVVWFLRGPLRKMRRRRRGLCLVCGYNLTGAPHARCPECGTQLVNPKQGNSEVPDQVGTELHHEAK